MPPVVSKPEIIHGIALRAFRQTVEIRDSIEQVLREKGMSVRDASKEATRLRVPVELAIDNHLRTFEGRQLVTYFQRDTSQPHRARPAPEAGDFRWTATVQALLMRMPPGKFEVLLGNVLVGLECAKVAVTPMTADGGVDFVGKVELSGKSPIPAAMTGPSPLAGQSLYLFGQAKRYSLANPVEVAEIDELVGATRGLVKGGGTAVKDRMIKALRDWGWDTNSLLMPLFATSGRFRSSIPGYARTQKFGIFDGEQLAQRVIYLVTPLRSWRDVQRTIARLTSAAREHVTLFA